MLCSWNFIRYHLLFPNFITVVTICRLVYFLLLWKCKMKPRKKILTPYISVMMLYFAWNKMPSSIHFELEKEHIIGSHNWMSKGRMDFRVNRYNESIISSRTQFISDSPLHLLWYQLNFCGHKFILVTVSVTVKVWVLLSQHNWTGNLKFTMIRLPGSSAQSWAIVSGRM